MFPPGNPESLAIWPSFDHHLQATCLWRHPFEPDIQGQIVSEYNPYVAITNIDLEIAINIAQEDITSNSTSISHLTTCNFTDNTPAMDWRGKVSTTTTGPATYLLQISALHQHQYSNKPETHFIPGSCNIMADDCSRKCNLTNDELLTYFNLKYTQPVSWKILHLRPEMNSVLTLALLRRRSPPYSYLPEIKRHKRLGTSGVYFANKLMQT